MNNITLIVDGYYHSQKFRSKDEYKSSYFFHILWNCNLKKLTLWLTAPKRATPVN